MLVLLLSELKSLYLDGFDFYKGGTSPSHSHYSGYMKWGGDTVKAKVPRMHNQMAQIVFFKTRLMKDSRLVLSNEALARINEYELVTIDQTIEEENRLLKEEIVALKLEIQNQKTCSITHG